MSIFALVVAILFFVLAALSAHGNLHWLATGVLFALGLACFAASFLPAAWASRSA